MADVPELYRLFNRRSSLTLELQADVLRTAAEILGGVPLNILLCDNQVVTVEDLYDRYAIDCTDDLHKNPVEADVLRLAARIIGKEISHILGIAHTSLRGVLEITTSPLLSTSIEQQPDQGRVPTPYNLTLSESPQQCSENHFLDERLEVAQHNVRQPYNNILANASTPIEIVAHATSSITTHSDSESPQLLGTDLSHNVHHDAFAGFQVHSEDHPPHISEVDASTPMLAMSTILHDYADRFDAGERSAERSMQLPLDLLVADPRLTVSAALPSRSAVRQMRTLVTKSSASPPVKISSSRTLAPARVQKPVIRPRSKSCVRCVNQKLKCIFEPGSVTCCKECREARTQNLKTALPCEVVDLKNNTTLYRTGSTLDTWKRFPFLGPKAGTLSIIKAWQPQSTQALELTQNLPLAEGGYLTIKLNLTQFDIPDELYPAERDIFVEPFALASLRHVEASVIEYVDRSMTGFTKVFIRDPSEDSITCKVFFLANQLACGSKSQLLTSTLRLWTAARMIENKWYKPDGSVQRLADHQLACVVLKFLEPLRRETMRMLQTTIKTRKRKEWVEIFLACYILLHSIELLMQQQRTFAGEMGGLRRWTNPGLIERLLVSSNKILIWFHACCGGVNLLSVNWHETKELGELDRWSRIQMAQICESIKNQEARINKVTYSDEYYLPFSLTGQLFEKPWEPRDISLSALTNAKRVELAGQQYVLNTTSELSTHLSDDER